MLYSSPDDTPDCRSKDDSIIQVKLEIGLDVDIVSVYEQRLIEVHDSSRLPFTRTNCANFLPRTRVSRVRRQMHTAVFRVLYLDDDSASPFSPI